MTPFLKASSKCWFITLTTKEGTYPRISSGTRDKDTAIAMQDMLTALARRGSRQWDLIDWLVEKNPATGRAYPGRVERLFDHYPDQLEQLRIAIAEEGDDAKRAAAAAAEHAKNVAFTDAINRWDRDLDVRLKAGHLSGETVKHYRRQVNWLFPKDESGARRIVARDTLTSAFLKERLDAVPGSSTNKRRHTAGWNSLFTFLVDAGELERNPLDGVKKPKNNKTQRPRIERLEDVIRFVNTFPSGPHRAAAAFQEGAGVEMQAMLNTRRRDIVDVDHRVMWAHGAKNDHRDRQVIVDDWAFKIILAYVKATPMHDDALLFGDITEDSHRAMWYEIRDTLRARGVAIPANYKPHSCRNTFAVRGLKTGRDPVLLSRNLGHADTSELLRLYGKFVPTITDMIRADQRVRGISAKD
jgi:site-specific recombinase XerC